MISNVKYTKKTALSFASAALLGVVSVFTLQSCGGSSSSAVIPVISVSAATISEGNTGTTNLDFTVTLSEATSATVSINYATSDGTAIAGQDYTATSGTLTIAPNTSSATISVPIVGDVTPEADETFNLVINGAVKSTITNGSQTVAGTINTDDLAGYYTGGGSVNLAAGSLDLTAKLQVIAADDRIVIIDLTDDLVYIAPLINFDGDTFTTTARIYLAGDVLAQTTTISGNFSVGASMDLTLTGSGDYTTGSAALAYSAKNAVTPVVFSPNDQWNGSTGGILFNTSINIRVSTGNNSSDNIADCDDQSINIVDVTSEQTGRIKAFTASSVVNCSASVLNGYFTTINGTTDDSNVLFVWFNNDGVYTDNML